MAEVKRYCIVPVADLTDQMILDCLETSMDTLRRNNADTMAVLKYVGEKPVILLGYDDYTHAEILVEMLKPEWIMP